MQFSILTTFYLYSVILLFNYGDYKCILLKLFLFKAEVETRCIIYYFVLYLFVAIVFCI